MHDSYIGGTINKYYFEHKVGSTTHMSEYTYEQAIRYLQSQGYSYRDAQGYLKLLKAAA